MSKGRAPAILKILVFFQAEQCQVGAARGHPQEVFGDLPSPAPGPVCPGRGAGAAQALKHHPTVPGQPQDSASTLGACCLLGKALQYFPISRPVQSLVVAAPAPLRGPSLAQFLQGPGACPGLLQTAGTSGGL